MDTAEEIDGGEGVIVLLFALFLAEGVAIGNGLA
jgi:hypothetical protein